jgi:hypothetical protein
LYTLFAGRDALTKQEISFIRSAYAGATGCGRAENPPDRTGERSHAGKLVERYHTHHGMILRSCWTWPCHSPRTRPNEHYDQSSCNKQKISATWHLLQGLADFAAIRSYLDTAAKHGLDTLTVRAAIHHRTVDARRSPKLNTYVLRTGLPSKTRTPPLTPGEGHPAGAHRFATHKEHVAVAVGLEMAERFLTATATTGETSPVRGQSPKPTRRSC